VSTFEERQADAVFEIAPPAEHRSEADLWIYWTVGKGRDRWATKAEPLRALYDLLVAKSGMSAARARATALAWFPDGMHRPIGQADGQLPGASA
jgi:hypothetical protein